MRKARCNKNVIVNPDMKYNNVQIQKLINCIMREGKKTIAEKICYGALEKAAEEVNMSVNDFFHKIITSVQPNKYTVSKRFGGNTYDIPKEVPEHKKPLRAIHIISNVLKDEIRSQGKCAIDVLTNLFIQTYNGIGKLIEKKDALHKKADANAAFSHFGW